MRIVGTWILVAGTALSALPADAGTKQTCRKFVAEHYPDLGVLPRITRLDDFVAAPDDKDLRDRSATMLTHQDPATLEKLAERIAAAYEDRDACVGNVGKKVTLNNRPVETAAFLALVDGLHEHGLPLIRSVLDERQAGQRARAEAERTEQEIVRITETWKEPVERLSAQRAEASAVSGAASDLRKEIDTAETRIGKCLARAYLLEVHPFGDGYVDEIRAFAECSDGTMGPANFGVLVRDAGMSGAASSRNAALHAGDADRSIAEWSAILEVFGGEAGGDWTEPLFVGLPESIEKLDVGSGDWASRSRVQLGLYCLGRGREDCAEAALAGDDGLAVPELTLASIAEDLAEAGDPMAVSVWRLLEARGTRALAYVEDRVRFQAERGQLDAVRDEMRAAVASGDCKSAVRIFPLVTESGSSDPIADAQALAGCTEVDDPETAGAAWAALADAYKATMEAHMSAQPQRLSDAVALARKTLAIPGEFQRATVSDYANYVIDVSEQRRTNAVDSARAAGQRLEGCTQLLSTVVWKRNREEDFEADLVTFRGNCCAFLRSNRAKWVAWMESGPETRTASGRKIRREFTREEIKKKQSELDRYCSAQ